MCPSTYWASPASCVHVIFNSEQYRVENWCVSKFLGKEEAKALVFCGPWWWQDLASGQKWYWCWPYVPAVELSAWQESKLWQVVLSRGNQLPQAVLKGWCGCCFWKLWPQVWSFSTSKDSVSHSVAF